MRQSAHRRAASPSLVWFESSRSTCRLELLLQAIKICFEIAVFHIDPRPFSPKGGEYFQNSRAMSRMISRATETYGDIVTFLFLL